MPNVYQELKAYSATHDCDVARISMADDRGSEFFMLVADRGGKRGHWRAARNTALALIQEAIREGCEPGQVVVDQSTWDGMVGDEMREQAA